MSSPTELAERLDALAGNGTSSVTETEQAIVVSGIDDVVARAIFDAANAIRWTVRAVDAANELYDRTDFDPDFAPFRLDIRKPEAACARSCVTAQGLRQALQSETPEPGIWWVAGLGIPFATDLVCFVPWGGSGYLPPAQAARKSPRDLVREAAQERLVPADIRLWLLHMPIEARLWIEGRFQVVAELAAPALVRCLASEVSGMSNVSFSASPRRNLILKGDSSQTLGLSGLSALVDAARWVYEDESSTHQRHALYAAEVGRSVEANADVAAALTASGPDILQGAQFAYELAMADLGKEALRAQADLRKAVADDTARAAEGARSIATSLATAFATAIGLFVARSSSSAKPEILVAIAVLVAVYLLTVSISSFRYLSIQKSLRHEWRTRFYRFVPDLDYRKMVTEPVERAEQVYRYIAGLCFIAALGLGLFVAFEICNQTWSPAPAEAAQHP